jgi:hypothetical protein
VTPIALMAKASPRSITTAIDPVCGMTVETTHAAPPETTTAQPQSMKTAHRAGAA